MRSLARSNIAELHVILRKEITCLIDLVGPTHYAKWCEALRET